MTATLNTPANYLVLKSLTEADRFVERQQRLGNDVRWEGWTMVFFKPDPRGMKDPRNGAVRGGAYGFDNKVPVTDAGTWEVDYRNVRRAKRPRD